MRKSLEKLRGHLPFVRTALRWTGGDRARVIAGDLDELLEALVHKNEELEARVHALELPVDQLVEDACHVEKT